MTDAMIERVARELASLEVGEAWPTNEDLGGNPTGTRDDEYRCAMEAQARDVLDAAMPVVDTAEALQELPTGTPLIGRDPTTHKPMFWYMNDDMRERPDIYLRAFGPFRIWTPEVTP